jgi:drug/metabolite transporter (DMT)-like permease
MLAVLFTSRSGQRSQSMLREQLKLLALYAIGLAFGASILLAMRGLFVKIIFGKETPESADMLVQVAITMAFVGLMQALATWSLASRWFKLSVLYGAAGGVYWFVLIHWGKSPVDMLRLMPPIAGATFALLLIFWIITMKTAPHPTDPSDPADLPATAEP